MADVKDVKNIGAEDEKLEEKKPKEVKEEKEKVSAEKQEVDITQIPERIEEIYTQLDSIKNILSEIATAIRSGAEATKALTDLVENVAKKIDVPASTHKKVDEEKRAFEPKPKPAETATEASEIVEPKRVNSLQPVRAQFEVTTPRPEIEKAKVDNESEYGEILKQVLAGKVSFGDLGEIIKKLYVR